MSYPLSTVPPQSPHRQLKHQPAGSPRCHRSLDHHGTLQSVCLHMGTRTDIKTNNDLISFVNKGMSCMDFLAYPLITIEKSPGNILHKLLPFFALRDVNSNIFYVLTF